MKKLPLLLCLSVFLFAPIVAQATHIYSGYISYTVDPQNPLKLDLVFTLYTKISSTADDPFVMVSMGDGNTVRVERGKIIRYSAYYEKEIFTWSHTYAAPGNYTVHWTGENRNGGILNIPAPTDQVNLKILTRVKVGPPVQNPHGAKLAGAPLAAVYTGEAWTHNLLAYDEDGDQLHYELVTPKHRTSSFEIADIPGYWLPEGLTVNEFGELHWPAPGQKGEYVIAVKITEMRNGREIGHTVVDISLIVTERTDQPSISLLNKDRLTVNDDGSIQTWPGQPVKLEFYLQKHPQSNLPLSARQYGEIDTLELVEASFAVRDTAAGLAITYSFTPNAEMERTEPYLIGMRGRPIESSPQQQQTLRVEHAWAFAYIYVGEQRRPLSSGDYFPPEKPKLYPNPARGEFTFEAPDLPGLHLLVRDITGKVVASYTLQPGRNDFARPAKLASGLYTYTLTSQLSPIETGKLVLQ
ncbi:T9SS type A sorting domain-containing protein [Pontibacter ramchanderi]|uniref:Putative secreted protein (Por secretion system target) n=1 Tax=Pontibacter ramchanderi TaxID=1179743 RepID=A0A2N3UAU5_9BACT|nr:T9SS type A sorting domain-containing protein [Pontibacter ramchanderi]PKV66520.1 putative secreted protein (Por secretion system target) [Pontibacter ramchanderi]